MADWRIRNSMIIDCPRCESRVHGEILGAPHKYYDEGDVLEYRLALVSCPSCEEFLLGQQPVYQEDPQEPLYGDAIRLWPAAEEEYSWSWPEIVRNSLEEARRCFRAKAYTACAVMCGRALEGVCMHYSAKKKVMLASGLKELRENEIIDEKLFRWSEELRKHRNIGAHANTESISREDAQDLLDFATAICEYVFDLNIKFDKFMKRKEAESKEATEAPDDGLPF